MWRSDTYDTYKIQAKVLSEKFKRITGCYPRQLVFHERKSHGNAMSALSADWHRHSLRDASAYLPPEILRKNSKGLQRILMSLMLPVGHLADTRENDQTPRKQEDWPGVAGGPGSRTWGQELRPGQPHPQEAAPHWAQEEGAGFDPTLPPDRVLLAQTPSSPHPLVRHRRFRDSRGSSWKEDAVFPQIPKREEETAWACSPPRRPWPCTSSTEVQTDVSTPRAVHTSWKRKWVASGPPAPSSEAASEAQDHSKALFSPIK